MPYKQFLTVRVAGGVVLAVIAIWVLWLFLSAFQNGGPEQVAHVEEGEPFYETEAPEGLAHFEEEPPMGEMGHDAAQEMPFETGHEEFPGEAPHETLDEAAPHGGLRDPDFAAHGPDFAATHEPKATGVAFVEATISALDYELNERFWGWRPNDMIQFTDNVENIQRGVLEVVRRASVSLAERISRYGPTDVIDTNLENAMNWIMMKPDQYWLPSPEDKYDEAITELLTYAERLEREEASFYTRADNLIPLLLSFADLLGGCDDNLVKAEEEDGSPVSWSKVDDYFYYAKGAAKAMAKILHAVQIDFASTLEARGGMDLLEHAVHSCHIASELDPWLITDASLDGILANHRANMAAPISHARFYLDALAKTLET